SGRLRRMDDDGRHAAGLQPRRRDRYLLPAPRGLGPAGRARPHRDGRTQGLHGRGRDGGPALPSPRPEGSHAPDRRGVPLGRITRTVSELRTGQAPLLRPGHPGGSPGLVRQTPEAREGLTLYRLEAGRFASRLKARLLWVQGREGIGGLGPPTYPNTSA